jgi:uncharacterized membrane protein YphA (DoxX/SURF4 family)
MTIAQGVIIEPEITANIGWLIMRIGIAWLFLWPLPGLLRNWHATVKTTALIYPFPTLATAAGLVVMLCGSISVGCGIYGRIGGAALALYCIGGAFVHMALSRQPASLIQGLGLDGNAADVANMAAEIGAVGHVTSAWKNWTIAGACSFIALAGTGPLSIIQIQPLTFSGAIQ